MYKSSLLFDRTPDERRDMFKSWARSDQAFFASGACHTLAEVFVQLPAHEGYKMIYIKPAEGFTGNHVYASDGKWAFDHNGWTKEKELLAVTNAAYREKSPGWKYKRVVIEGSASALEDFCKAYNHRLPWQFAHMPWERAYQYIAQFSADPPS